MSQCGYISEESKSSPDLLSCYVRFEYITMVTEHSKFLGSVFGIEDRVNANNAFSILMAQRTLMTLFSRSN